MLVCVHGRVWLCGCGQGNLRLSHLQRAVTLRIVRGGISRLPDTLPHYLSVSSLLSSHLPVTVSLSRSLSFNLVSSKRAYQIVEVTFSRVDQNHAYQFSSGLEVLASPPY